jgi:hypothetical protein
MQVLPGVQLQGLGECEEGAAHCAFELAMDEWSMRRTTSDVPSLSLILPVCNEMSPLLVFVALFGIGQEVGRGLQGRGRGFDMGSITVPDRSLQRQKKPSVTLVFCTVTQEAAGSSPVAPASNSSPTLSPALNGSGMMSD